MPASLPALAAGLAAAGLLAGLPAVAAAAVPASLGSVPAEVEAYVEDGALIDRLADLYGPDASGERGIDFDDSTRTGGIARVHAWTEARLAGEETEEPLRMLNEWVVPISVGEEPVGLATIGIDPASVLPGLAAFDPDPELAAALAEIPAKAALVRDEGAGAWFALEEGVLAPLVPGRSGLESPAPLADVAILPPELAVEAEGSSGLPVAIGALVLLLLVIVAALLLPSRPRRAAPADPDASAPE